MTEDPNVISSVFRANVKPALLDQIPSGHLLGESHLEFPCIVSGASRATKVYLRPIKSRFLLPISSPSLIQLHFLLLPYPLPAAELFLPSL